MNVTTCWIDLAKNLFQVHGVNSRGKPVVKKQAVSNLKCNTRPRY